MPTLEKQGYKYTEEFGYIPEDWEVIALGQVGNVSMCKRIMKDETTATGEVPFYKIGTFGGEPDAYISKEKFETYKNKYSYPNKEDILISAAGTIGRAVIFDGKPAYFQDSNIVWLQHNNNKVLNKYLYYVYKTAPWYTTTGGTIARLYNENITKAVILKPSLKEQEKIAEALGDVDSLIDKTQQLINKKKDLKTATMQKLLTPKEDWITDILGNVCEIKKGSVITSQSMEEGDIPVIAGGKTPAYYNNKYNRDGKTITISASGASAGYVWFHNYPIYASDCSTISESSNYCIEFIYYFLLSKQNYIYNCQAGGAQPHIHPSDLEPLILNYPSDIKIQEQIATILSDMDSEIEALEKELNKYKDLKTGMMQQLLTGKVRLI